MTPLVLVHGFMGGSAQWDGQRAALSQTRDIITLDLPGFGRNAHLPAINRIGGFADWVIEQLRERGLQKYHLLGHSMGGMIAQEITRRDQDNIEKLILYGTGASGVLPGRFETIARSKERAVQDGAKATGRRIAATWFLDRAEAEHYEACAAIAEQTTPQAIAAGLDAMEHWSGVDFLPQITCPTRVIWGDSDRTYAWAQVQQLWNTIPNTELAVVPGCAHAVHLEKVDLFNDLVLDFLTP